MTRHYPCTMLPHGHTAELASPARQPIVGCDGTGCDCPYHTDTWPPPEGAAGQRALFG